MKFINNALILFLARSASAQIDGIFGSANASAIGDIADLEGALAGLANATQDLPDINLSEALNITALEGSGVEGILGGNITDIIGTLNTSALEGLGFTPEQLEGILGGNMTDITGGLFPEGGEDGGFTDFFGTMPTFMGLECPETCPAELCSTDPNQSSSPPDEQIVSEACDAGTIKDCFVGLDMVCSTFCSGGTDLSFLGEEVAEAAEANCVTCSFVECCDGTNTYADTCKTLFDDMMAIFEGTSTFVTGATPAATEGAVDEDMDEHDHAHDDEDGHDHGEDTDADALEGEDGGNAASGQLVSTAASIVAIGLVLAGL